MSWLPIPYLCGHTLCEDDGEFEGVEIGVRWGKLRAFVVIAWRDRQL